MSDLSNKNVKELHALCSYAKSCTSQDAMDNLMKIRELCGGHGYSSYSRIPSLIYNHNI